MPSPQPGHPRFRRSHPRHHRVRTTVEVLLLQEFLAALRPAVLAVDVARSDRPDGRCGWYGRGEAGAPGEPTVDRRLA
ncbi:hypothetical protein ACFV1W_21800 [Kitasatospora sp. NPDC059648]|uniref:hypothetical protein n=1 Tax=Kitasatospora sp. NPDC059648 TaxID=3346894 RepID=UPI00367ECC26